MTNQTPREIDTELAAKWHEIAKAEQQLAYSHRALLSLAGAQFYYRGRQRVTDMTLAEAIERVTEAAAYIETYVAENTTPETSTYTTPEGEERSYEYQSTDWSTL